ncbi:hypothetical protein RRF57_012980 [Xylaria bambusicola]|uniref:Uncharacterized protein n=1 Tax=Xylaria bambusicola TaxID=326684 RepID=A0AAN7ZF44_9PEZI
MKWQKEDCKIRHNLYQTRKLTHDSALIDGRTGWTLLEGQEMVIGYASEAEIRSWGEYELGDTAPLREKVAELYRNGIKAKFKFVKPQSTMLDR